MRLSRARKTDLLKKIPLFSGCSRAELEAVGRVADELTLPAGTVLMREGEAGKELVVLVDGEVDVDQGGSRIATRTGGDFLGELALVTQRPRTATVTARSDIRVLVVSAQSFHRLLQDVPPLAVKVLRAVGERLGPEEP
jgi:CRP/FNR family transcriptional regulator, cyclic AMP receptor protein